MMTVRTRFADRGTTVAAKMRPYRSAAAGGTTCPGCGGRGWRVGLSSAECMNKRCGWLLPIERPVE
jgi:hypothetical protein